MISFLYEDLGLVSFFYNVDQFVFHLFPKYSHWVWFYYDLGEGLSIFGFGPLFLLGFNKKK